MGEREWVEVNFPPLQKSEAFPWHCLEKGKTLQGHEVPDFISLLKEMDKDTKK